MEDRRLRAEIAPYRLRRLTDAAIHYEFSGERRQYVVALVQRVQFGIGEFSFESHGDEQFFAHQAKTADLGGPVIAKKSHRHRLGLAYPP